MLVAFAGVSGCGKNTIINELLKQNKNFSLMPSLTTRPMREGESEGKPYLFVTVEEFEKRTKNGEMIETMEVHKGTVYGTSWKVYNDLSEKYDVLLKDIDVNGIENVKKAGIDCVSIFINVSDIKELEKRLIERGTEKGDIEKRLSRAEYENSKKDEQDYIVDNNSVNDLPLVISKISDIIFAELKKRKK